MATIASLNVNLSANIDDFIVGVEKGSDAFNQFVSGLSNTDALKIFGQGVVEMFDRIESKAKNTYEMIRREATRTAQITQAELDAGFARSKASAPAAGGGGGMAAAAGMTQINKLARIIRGAGPAIALSVTSRIIADMERPFAEARAAGASVGTAMYESLTRSIPVVNRVRDAMEAVARMTGWMGDRAAAEAEGKEVENQTRTIQGFAAAEKSFDADREARARARAQQVEMMLASTDAQRAALERQIAVENELLAIEARRQQVLNSFPAEVDYMRDRMLASLDMEQRQVTQEERWLEQYLAGQEERAARMAAEAAARKTLTDAIQSSFGVLQQEAILLRDGATELEAWRLRQAGATLEQINAYRAAARTVEALREKAEAEREAAAEAERAQERIAASAKSVFESTRTPQERFAVRIRELGDLLNRQLIDWDTYRRAVKYAIDTLPAGAVGGRRTVDQLGAGQNVASERMSAMFAIREENLRKRDEDKE
ncbi:MAG TPA: hypothetical protein VM487_17355, partial [Phycisphaerae bacterium]|nr:hypothetical protein [Phycisphaerae bacterium]